MKLVYTSSGEHNALSIEKEKSIDDDLPSLGSFEAENVSSTNLEDFQVVSIYVVQAISLETISSFVI